MFSVVNVYLDQFGVVCINGRMYVCCSECNVVSDECNEPTSCLVQPIGTHCGEVMYFGCVCFGGELGCDYICMSVMNKQFEPSSLFMIPFLLACNIMRFLSLLLLCCVTVLCL